MLYLARLIREAYRSNGVVTAYVYGDFGYGKTSYALWVSYQVYGNWEDALRHLVFKPEDALSIIGDAIDSGRRVPLIVMDDAGLWLDKLTWWERPKVRFMELFNLIRSVTAGIIFTTPSRELPQQLVNKLFYRVRVEPLYRPETVPGVEQVAEYARSLGLKPYVSKAMGYKLKTLPQFFNLIKKQFVDYYPTHYPVFREYEEKRRKALKYYYSKVIEALEEEKRSSGAGFDPDDKRSVRSYIRRKLREGVPRREVVEELMRAGLPRSTAYYHVKKVAEEMGRK